MYYQQLNSVRAVAVMMVIVFHWLPDSHHFILPLGSWGVEMFFVLSGFLITKILLESRTRAEAEDRNKLGEVKNFLLRRCLRIFPIYYLTLLVILIVDRANVSGLKDHLLYFVGYASNHFYFSTQQFSYPMAHFWSLAVEEQFYLVWPWFILFLPAKYLRPFLIASIGIGILSRVIFPLLFSYSAVTPDVLTLSCFDGFSIGGLFAWYVWTQKTDIKKVIRVINIAGLAAFIVMMVLLVLHNNTIALLHRTISSIFFLAFIANAFIGIKGLLGRFAGNSFILYLGQISYGLYIYHLVTPWLTKVLLNASGKFKNSFLTFVNEKYTNASTFPKFTIDFSILLLVASLSWYVVEKPVNRYKYLFR